MLRTRVFCPAALLAFGKLVEKENLRRAGLQSSHSSHQCKTRGGSKPPPYNQKLIQLQEVHHKLNFSPLDHEMKVQLFSWKGQFANLPD